MRRLAAVAALTALLAAMLSPMLALAEEGEADVIRTAEIPAGARQKGDAASWWQWVSIEGGDDAVDYASSGQYDVRVEWRTQQESNAPKTYKEFEENTAYKKADKSGLDETSRSFIEMFEPEVTEIDVGKAKIDGIEFWYRKRRTRIPTHSIRYTEKWFAPLADGGYIEIVITAGVQDGKGYDLGPWQSQAVSVREGLKFNLPESARGGLTGEDRPKPGSLPWRDAAAGAGALAAAATALAGAAAKTAPKKGKGKRDPKEPVGFILQLSSRQMRVTSQGSQTLTASVYRVAADGTYTLATDALVQLTPPAGIAVQPSSGNGSVQAAVWQDGQAAERSAIRVSASTGQGGHEASVAVTTDATTTLSLRFEPAEKTELRAFGDDSVTLVGAVELSEADAASLDAETVNSSIDFSCGSDWADMSQVVDWPPGRAVRVMASQPDPLHPVQPPETATVICTAKVGEKTFSETATITFARNPSIDARPDTVEFSAESGETADVRVWIENGAGAGWTYRTAWRDGSKELADVEQEPGEDGILTLTLTENSKGKLDPARPEEAATLRVIASADGWDDLERYVKVIVTQEGLFVDPIGRDQTTGRFVVDATGSGEATEVDLRVYVRDTEGRVVADIDLAQSVEFDVAAQEGTPGYAALKSAGFSAEPAGVRDLNVDSATFRLAMERMLPTGPEPLPAAVTATVPGQEGEAFTRQISLSLRGVDTEPFSESWNLEYERCERVISQYVPAEYQVKLHRLLSERGKTMGAEGLYRMRHQLWSFAHDQLVKEAHEYLDEAWWYQQVEDTLDWVSWCGDIALQVATGGMVGTPAVIAFGLLKPVLVSAMTTWVNGGSIEDWAWDQVKILAAVVEGAATDVDFLAKLSGDKKAIAWAAFIAYYFVKELIMDPELSVTNAMKNTARMIRDEALVIFIRRAAGIKPPGAAGAGADAPGAPKGTKTKPGAVAPGTPPPRAPKVPKKPVGSSSVPGAKPKPKPPAQPPATPGAKPGAPDAKVKPEPGSAKTKPDAPGTKAKPEGPETGKTKPDAPDKAPDKKAPGPKTNAAETIRKGMTTGPDGQPRAKKSDVLEIMRDPQKVRDLKNAPPEVQAAFENTRNHIYEGHDMNVENYVRSKVPGMANKEIKVQDFRTPGKDGKISINTDRDYRVCYKDVDPKTGKEIWIEVDRRHWEKESYRSFAEETGGPTHPPEAAQHWAEQHQQLGTDKYHAEAGPDFSDQAMIFDEKTGTWRETQIESNISLVRKGQSTLVDPEGMGSMYKTKVGDAMKGGKPTSEAFVQANKAVTELDACRKGYADQKYEVGDIDPQMRQGMDIVKKAAGDPSNPAMGAAADAELKAAGFKGGLPEFMNKMSGQWGAFKWAKK